MTTTSSNNLVGLYGASGSSVTPGTAYGNANVVSLLETSTDGANTIGNISATGNVTADYFIGDGSQLTNINAGNIVGAYSNANVVSLMASFGSNTVSTTGNVTAGYLFGNGSQLTGLPATYTDANVTTLLANFGSNTISTTGNITGGNFVGSGAALTNITGANVTGSVANATYANTAGLAAYVTANAQANITSVGVLSSLSVSGNTTVSNISGSGTISTSGNIDAQGTMSVTGNIVTAGYFVGNFAGNITGNITVPGSNTQVLFNTNGNADAVGGFTYDKGSNTMTVLGIVSAQGNVIGGNVNATGIFAGNAAGLTNIPGANVTGTVPLAGYVTNAAQANITSLGTLTGLNASGNISTTGNVIGNYFIGNGSQLTGLPAGYSNAEVASYLASGTNTSNIITSGNVSGAYILGNGSALTSLTGSAVVGNVANAVHAFTADSANSVSGSNVSGAVANAVYATSAGTAATVTGNAQANITSVGILTSLSSTGNVTAAYFIGNGSQLTGVVGTYGDANVRDYLAGGTNTANIITSANIQGAYILGNGSQLTGLPAGYSNSDVSTYLASGTNSANIITSGNVSGAYFLGNGSQLTGVVATSVGVLPSLSVTGNIDAGNVNSTFYGNGAGLTNITGGNVTGTVASASLAQYVTANAQANITSLGTLTGLNSTGNISTSGNIIGAYLWGDGSNITGVVSGAQSVRVAVKNTSGGSLAAGTPVYATGTVGATTVLEVAASRADTSSTMPAIGLLETTLAVNGTGYAISVGTLTGIDTSTYSIGTILYVAATGGLTATRPNNGYLVQPVGTVGRVNASTGSIDTNIWNYFQLPNLGSGNIWLGNASSIPTETPLTTNIQNYLYSYAGNIGNANVGPIIIGNTDATGTNAYLGLESGGAGYLVGRGPSQSSGLILKDQVADNTIGIIGLFGTGTNQSEAWIRTGNASSSKTWTFSPDGNLKLPGASGDLANINYANNVNILQNINSTTVSASGNVTGNWVIGTTALQARNTSVVGNIVAAPGNIVISKTFGSDGIYAPEGSSASVMANGQVIMGYGYNGNVNANAISTNSQGQGTRFLFWDYVQRGNTAAQGRQITAARVTELTANVTNANFREIALAGHMQVGGGTAGYSATTTTPFFFNGLNGRLQFGNDSSGGPNVGNITTSHGTAMVATIATYGGSNVGNSLALLLNNQSFGLTNVTNMIGLGFNGVQSTGNTVGNWYGIAHTGSTSTFGYSVPAATRAQTTNYYMIYNTDDLAQNQMGPLRSYQEVNYTSGTSGTVDVNKQNGQVQTIVLAGNVTIGSFTNFVTTASATANSVTKTTQQTDTVTLIIKQGATPYTVTMPTGNAQIKYAANVTSVGSTANAVTMVSITGANISGTNTYMVTISPEFI